MERCREYIAANLPANWDGVFVMNPQVAPVGPPPGLR